MVRRLVLEKRRVNTRESCGVTLFTIRDIESHFDETLSQAYKQIKLAEELSIKGLTEESEGILRLQIVLVESAYDYYLHELLRWGVVKIFTGEWEGKGKQYQELELPLRVFELAMKNNNNYDWLKEWVTEKYSHLTLMDYPQLKYVCGLLGLNIRDVAELAFYKVGSQDKSEYELERQIRETYRRRNQIVHQSDRKTGTAERENINRDYVEGRIMCIRKVVLALCEVARRKDRQEQNAKKVGSWMIDLRAKLIGILMVRMNKLATNCYV